MFLKYILLLMNFVYPYKIRSNIAYRLNNKVNLNNKNKNNVLRFAKNIKMDLSPTDTSHRQIIMTGFYELELSKRIKTLSKRRKGILIDVGANYGYFSLLWCANNCENIAYAFEPLHSNYVELIKNIEKNSKQKQILSEQLALSHRRGEMKFVLNNLGGETGWGGFTLNKESEYINVETTLLDEYCKRKSIENICVLKIDTEGADTWVLNGAKELLRTNKIENIFFEINKERMNLLGISENEPFNFLSSFRYKIKKIAYNEYCAYI